MKKKVFNRVLLFLGFFLFFTIFLPNLTPSGVSIAQANSIEKDKSPDYRLYLKSITLIKGKTFTLKVNNLSEHAKVSFKSADAEIASVNEDGTITAKMVGTTTITAIVKDGLTTTNLTCDVTVGPPAFSVKMTRSRIIIGVNKSDTLSVILKPSNTAENAIFSSHNSSVVSVTSGGRISGNKVGLTYLFAEIDALNHDGKRKFAMCTAIVVNPEDVQPLETYFNEHPELNLLSEADLTSALHEFFNKAPDAPVSPTPTASAQKEEANLSLVDSLHQFLSTKFDLAALRKTMEDSMTNSVS